MQNDDARSLFEAWLVTDGAAIFRIARAYTGSPEDRQDLAQEILLQCWKSILGFQGRSALTTWFYRIALNTAINWKRDQATRTRISASPFDADHLIDPVPDVVQSAADRERLEQLYSAVRSLKPTDAACILMHLDGLTYREIADVTGMTESHVGVKLNRARRDLTDLMREQLNE